MLAFDLDGIFAPNEWLNTFVDALGYAVFKNTWSILRNPHLPCVWTPPLPPDSYIVITSRTVLEETKTTQWLSKHGLSTKLFCKPLEIKSGIAHKIERCKALGVTLYVESEPNQTTALIEAGINAITFEEYKCWLGKRGFLSSEDIQRSIIAKALNLPFNKPLTVVAIADSGIPFAVDLCRAYTLLGGQASIVAIVPKKSRPHDVDEYAIGKPEFLGNVDKLKHLSNSTNLLLVDDTVDSGETLVAAKEWLFTNDVKVSSPWALTFWTSNRCSPLVGTTTCETFPTRRQNRVEGYAAGTKHGVMGAYIKVGDFIW